MFEYLILALKNDSKVTLKNSALKYDYHKDRMQPIIIQDYFKKLL